jgi:hypothetical protein
MDIDKQTNYNRDILKNILYISVNLDYSSKQQLESFFNEHNIWQNKNIKLLCHHMTITFHTVLPYHILEYTYKNIGEDKDMKVVGYGVSEKAFAAIRFTQAEQVENAVYFPKFSSRDLKARTSYQSSKTNLAIDPGELYILDIIRGGMKDGDPRLS